MEAPTIDRAESGMRVDVRSKAGEIPTEQREQAERAVRLAVGPLVAVIRQVEVRLGDADGLGARLSELQLELMDGQRMTAIGTGLTDGQAMDRALDRACRALHRVARQEGGGSRWRR